MPTTKKPKAKSAAPIISTDGGKLQIASAIRPLPSTADLLSQLTGGPAPSKAASAKTVGFQLSAEIQELLLEHVEADALATFCNEHHETVKGQLKGEIWPLYLAKMFADKTQPDNPTLKTQTEDGRPDCQAQYLIQARFKVDVNTAAELVAALVSVGVNAEKAQQLADNEMDFQPSVAIKFNELMYGHYEGKDLIPATEQEQAVANKAMQLLLSIPGAEPLTDEEKGILISRKAQIKVKKGFLERVATYADTLEQLTNILAIIKPVEVARGAKFGISDTIPQRNDRLLKAASRILGISST